ncbi:MAG: RecX family transcriptional regulator [Aureispira sp.]|nr:RecX family transcriptional regulator [Aureispira sp.]
MAKYLSYDEALAKLQRYCAYQERCHKEVRNKLIELGIYGNDLENIICDLIEDKFLNEQRFANVYAGGKFRQKKWGKQKIKIELKKKYVSIRCIDQAIKEEIPEEDYYNTLVSIIKKKDKFLTAPNLFQRRQKLAKYTISKGYESWLVWEVLKELYPY